MRWIPIALFLGLLAGWTDIAAADEAVLTITVGGVTRSIGAEALLMSPDVVEIQVDRDEGYRRPMSYRAVPLAELLDETGAAGADAVFEFKALDGYVAHLSCSMALNRDSARAVAMLAIEDPANPWPALPGKEQSAGPFSIVWTGPGAGSVRGGQWPYQVVSVTETVSPLARWPQLAVNATLPDDDPRRQGQQLFLVQCLVCHRLAGGGDAEVGPDLNLPMSPTEYFTLPALQKYLRDPASVRNWADRKMPAFEPSSLGDAEIDLIILYLQHKAAMRR